MTFKWKNFHPKSKEIWQINLSDIDAEGHEQKGDRPCMIIREFPLNELVLIIPITGELTINNRFSFTVLIKKDDGNGLNCDSVALIFQIKSVSKNRLRYQIGRINNSQYDEIKVQIKEMFGFEIKL